MSKSLQKWFQILKLLSYLTVLLYVLSGVVAVGFAFTFYSRYAAFYLLMGGVGLVLAISHLPVLLRPFKHWSLFLFLALIGINAGITAFLYNINLLVGSTFLLGATTGITSYIITQTGGFQDPGGDPN